MRLLVTGGAGFIGRWVVKRLLEDNHEVVALDNLSNGSRDNIKEFINKPNFLFIEGDIQDEKVLNQVFSEKFDIVFHLAASINVQDSIDNPRDTFNNDVIGTFNVLEQCRHQSTKVLFMSTCMVFERSSSMAGINESHPVKPASPYAASKLAGEALTLSYYYAYGLPTVVVRPFNTYGPHQKSSGEGGVVSIFIQRALKNQDLNIYGDGTQTRDLLYVEDCADFIIKAGFSSQVDGEIINAGTGSDITINDLAALICANQSHIKHVAHIHPQSEIPKLLCDYTKSNQILGWKPQVDLPTGIKLTMEWIKDYQMD